MNVLSCESTQDKVNEWSYVKPNPCTDGNGEQRKNTLLRLTLLQEATPRQQALGPVFALMSLNLGRQM